MCLIRCAHNDEHIGVGIHCLFLYVGSFRNLAKKNKQKEVPRFFYNYTDGAFGANFPQNKMKKMKKLFYSAICLMVCLLTACKENGFNEPEAPAPSDKVITGNVSETTAFSAILYSEIKIDISLYESVEFGVMIGESREELIERKGNILNAKVLDSNKYKVLVDNLLPQKKYYYCSVLFLNNMQYEFGGINNFTTLETTYRYVAKPFSISSTNQVYFSKGNLQYNIANKTWRFADNQSDYIGAVKYIPTEHDGWIDMFCWNTGNNPTSSTAYYDQKFIDWGINNIGNEASNTYYTLSVKSWEYLLREREVTHAGYYSDVVINDVNGVSTGLMLLPDDWTCPSGITFGNKLTFTTAQWAELEATGAVFLRNGSYWTSSNYHPHAPVDGANYFNTNFNFYGWGLYENYADTPEEKCAVRLVKKVQ